MIQSKPKHTEAKRVPIRRTLHQPNPTLHQIAISTQGKIDLIDVDQIAYLKSDSNYTEIHLLNGSTIVTSTTLKKFEEKLKKTKFMRVHNSYIIQKNQMNSFLLKNNTVILRNTQTIPVSRSKKEGLMKYLKLMMVSLFFLLFMTNMGAQSFNYFQQAAGDTSDYFVTIEWQIQNDATSCVCVPSANTNHEIHYIDPNFSNDVLFTTISNPQSTPWSGVTIANAKFPGGSVSYYGSVNNSAATQDLVAMNDCLSPCSYNSTHPNVIMSAQPLKNVKNLKIAHSDSGSATLTWDVVTDTPFGYELRIKKNDVFVETIFDKNTEIWTDTCPAVGDFYTFTTYFFDFFNIANSQTSPHSITFTQQVYNNNIPNNSISGTVVTKSCNGESDVTITATLMNPEDLSNGSCWPTEYTTQTTGTSGEYTLENLYRGVGSEMAEYAIEATFPATQNTPARAFRNRTAGAGCPFNQTDSVRTVILSSSNNNPMGESFVDVSSFLISGTVTSVISGCGLEDVDITEAPGGGSGITPVKTKADGSFQIVVTEGNKDYEIWARYRNESIADSILTVTVGNTDVTEVSFLHTATDTLKGFIGAGCGEYIGAPFIEIRSPDSSCVIASPTTNSSGYFEAILPSRPINIEITGIELTPGIGITDEGAVLSGFGGSIDSDLDSTTTLNFLYRKPLTIEVKGFPALSCAAIPYPVVKQGDTYVLSIFVNEGENCPVDTGKIIIYDNIGVMGVGGQIVDSVVISQGVGYYELEPGDPIFFGDHTKNITFQAIAGEEMTQVTKKAVVTGAVQSGNNFTTAAPTELPFLILRDPPGDQSYSEFLQENVTTIAQTYSTQLGGGVKVWAEAKVGVDIFGLEIWGQIGGSFEVNSSESTTEEFILELTNSQTFRTSDDENVVGEKGDVFVGAAVNFIYARAKVLDFDLNDCAFKLDTLLMLNANGFETTFIYTEGWIRDEVIPTRQELADNTSLPDSVRYRALKDVKLWEQVLQLNEDLKKEALLDPVNISLNAGTGAYTESKTISKSNTKTIEFTTQIDVGIAAEVGFEYNNNGVTAGVDVNFQTILGEVQSQATTTTTTTSFHLSDGEIDDNSWSINVAEDPVFGTPVFKTLGGQTSCPYEENTERLDDLVVVVQQPVQEISSGNEAFYFFDIINNSYDSDPRSYMLALNLSSAGGVDITYGGSDFGSPILISNLNQGINSIATPIKVTKPGGLQQFDFEGIQFFLYSLCEDTESYTQADYSVPFTISAYFDSPCSNVDLLAPNENWEISGADNNQIFVSMAGYDLSSDFDQIIMQYQKDGGNWQPSDVVRTKAQLSVGSTMVPWDVTNFEDGAYSIRFRLNCGNVYSFSNRVKGLIDRSAPTVFGIEKPTNDRYQPGGEISVDFNEALDCSALTFGNVYMRTLPENELVAVHAMCDSNRIMIQLINEIGHLYNQAYEVGVVGVTDIYNNVRPDTVKWEFVVSEPDSDDDGNPDTKDICPGGNDFIDVDMDGLPDDCDCLPNDPSNGRTLTKAALDFDGVDDFIQMDTAYGTVYNNFTYEFWVNPQNNVAPNVAQIGVGLSPIGEQEPYVIYPIQGEVSYGAAHSTAGVSVGKNGIIVFEHSGGFFTTPLVHYMPIIGWTHVAISFVEKQASLFVNGKFIKQGLQSTFMSFVHPSSKIGGRGTGALGNAYYKGKMDEVRYWDHALTQGEILQNMNKELFGFESGLVSNYDFNEGTPFGDNSDLSMIVDKSTNGHHGIPTNFTKSGVVSNWVKTPTQKLNVAYTLCEIPCPDTVRVALDFSQTGGSNTPLLQVPSVQANNPTSTHSVTFEAWLKPGALPSGFSGSIIEQFGLNAQGNGIIQKYYMSYTPEGYLLGEMYNSSNFISNAVIPFDEWTHIALVFDQTQILLYINGDLDLVKAYTISDAFPFIPIQISNISNGSNFKGRMDDIRFWDGARSAQQIQDNYQFELLGGEPSLAAYYNFNDGAPGGNNGLISQVLDVSGNGLHGELFNFKKAGDDSNWVPSEIGLKDIDKDGTPDFCDACVAPKVLILENKSIGIAETFRAQEAIVLGENLSFLPFSTVIFKAKNVIMLDRFSGPGALPIQWTGGTFTISPDGCEE